MISIPEKLTYSFVGLRNDNDKLGGLELKFGSGERYKYSEDSCL